MSIEPDVPLILTEEEASAEWRDPNMTLYLRDSHLHIEQRQVPNGQWYLPSGNARAIFGEGYLQLYEIGISTDCKLEYNNAQNRIDIWGSEERIAKAKESLKVYWENYEERSQSKTVKSKKWARPERELTVKEKQRQEKKDARVALEKSFEGKPLIEQPYSSCFFVPNADVPINLLIGINNCNIRRISNECMTYVWYDSNDNSVLVSGPDEDNVKKATARVRNHYLKISRNLVCWSRLVMQKPKKEGRVVFIKRPDTLNMYKYCPEKKSVIIKAIDMDAVSHQPYDSNENLIDLFTECDVNGRLPELSPSLNTLDNKNKSKLKELLNVSLESVRLQKGKIKLEICFGHLLFLYAKTKNISTASFERMNAKLSELRSNDTELTPSITMSPASFENLLHHFSLDIKDPSQISDVQYLIEADQLSSIEAGHSFKPKGKNSVPSYTTMTSVEFNNDGSIKFWDCVLDQGKKVADFKCLNLENNSDFAIQLSYSPRMPMDPHTLHAKFIEKLTLGAGKRLCATYFPFGYAARVITQKTRWKAVWRDYVVELVKDEIWIVHHITKLKSNVIIDLSNLDPHRVSYKVSLYKEEWINRFSENISLSLGEAPAWKPSSFLCSKDENAARYLEDAAMFTRLLDKLIISPWNDKSAY